MNSIVFRGRLGRDAEMKQVGANDVLSFSVANDVGFGDRKTTNWFRCSIWGKRATALEQYLLKGKGVIIAGELKWNEYEKDGETRASMEVSVNSVEFQSDRESGGEQAPAAAPAQKRAPATAATEDDLPF